MIDALSGGSEAKRNDDGLSDASDSEDKGASEFAKNVINKMNNAAGNGNGGGGGDEEEDADDAGRRKIWR